MLIIAILGIATLFYIYFIDRTRILVQIVAFISFIIIDVFLLLKKWYLPSTASIEDRLSMTLSVVTLFNITVHLLRQGDYFFGGSRVAFLFSLLLLVILLYDWLQMRLHKRSPETT